MNVSVKSAMRIMVMSALVVLLLLVASSNVKAVANPYKGTNASSSTHAAWQYVYDNTGVILPNWGDDYNWWLSAKNAGFDMGTAAKAGSVAVYKSTKNNSKWDQVAYVTSVNGSKMNIKEGEFYNNGKWGEHTDTVDAKVGSLRFKGKYYEAKLVGFIYVYEAQRIEVSNLVSDTIPEGDYIIHSSANDNLVVTIDEGIKNKSNIALRTNKRNATTQVFSIKRNGNGYNITERNGTYALEVPGSNKRRGANVHIWNLPNNPNRPCAKWVFKKDGGFYNIFAINSGLAMEIYTGKAADGKNIVMWAYYNHTSERWRLEPYAVDIGKLTINGVVNKEYTGQAITQNPTIQINGQTLKQGTDYELSYRNNVNPGTATVVIKGKGAFYGSTERNFAITKKPNPPSGNGGQNGTHQRDDTKDEKMITSQKSDKDFKGAVFRKLRARETKTTKNSITLKWVKIKNASKYVIYGNKCGVKNKMKKLVTLKGGKTSWTHKKLAKGTYYKYTVVAYRGSGNNTKTVTISKTVHAATKGSKKTNCKAIAKVQGKVQLIMGRSFTLKPSQTKEVKSGKIHKHRAVGYESANTKICTVNKKGKITAKKKGKCNIFVYAQNGTYKICKINVVNKPSVKETAAKKIAAKKPGKVVITKCKPSKNKVALKWKKVKNAKKYILQVYIGGKWKNVCTTKKLGWTFKGKYKTKYKFRVCGLNGKIKGAYSGVKSCITPKKVVKKKTSNVKTFSGKVISTTYAKRAKQLKINSFKNDKRRLVILILVKPVNVTAVNGDGMGKSKRTIKVITLPNSYKKYAGKKVKIKITLANIAQYYSDVTGGLSNLDASRCKTKTIYVQKSKKKKVKIGKVKIKSAKSSGCYVTIKWGKAKNAKKYVVYVYIGGNWNKVGTTTKCRYKYKGKFNKKYKFRVCGINGSSRGAYTSTKKVKTRKARYPKYPYDITDLDKGFDGYAVSEYYDIVLTRSYDEKEAYITLIQYYEGTHERKVTQKYIKGGFIYMDLVGVYNGVFYFNVTKNADPYAIYSYKPGDKKIKLVKKGHHMYDYIYYSGHHGYKLPRQVVMKTKYPELDGDSYLYDIKDKKIIKNIGRVDGFKYIGNRIYWITGAPVNGDWNTHTLNRIIVKSATLTGTDLKTIKEYTINPINYYDNTYYFWLDENYVNIKDLGRLGYDSDDKVIFSERYR